MKRILRGEASVPMFAAMLGLSLLASEQVTAADLDASKGIPSQVDPVSDLNAHTAGTEAGWIDSIYFTSQVKMNGHDVGLLVATGRTPGSGGSVTITFTDQTTGVYKSYQSFVSESDYVWDVGKLNIKIPGLTWTGDSHAMSVQATTPWGSFNLNQQVTGPALNYVGSGVWPMLGATQNEFAYPHILTTGTVTLEGQMQQVSGESWLDRQWGGLPATRFRWTWMDISLSTGDHLAIWDVVGSTRENAFVTVLHPDGSYELAAVKPLAEDADQIWVSPSSGNSYPTRWRVEIPSLKAVLGVTYTGPQNQELNSSGFPSRMEITAAVTGTYESQPVVGKTYVEMVGEWR